MQFAPKTKLADIIHTNYLLLPILNRFDIQLGFGDKTVEEICREMQLNAEFFLVIINSFHDHNYFPQDQLQRFDLSLLVDYIKKSHSYYLDLKVPQIEQLIQNLSNKSDEQFKDQMSLIEKFFQDYKEEIITHIQEEENIIFPYILTIGKVYKEDKINKALKHLIQENSIDKFAGEHSNIEDKLFDLKNIIIKYLHPVKDNFISNTLLNELFRLERDLNDHARIEDKVLIPKVQYIEQEILRKV
jgi:regulator of cell morphogenesis and NO signaling